MTLYCDDEHNQITIGDVSNPKNCLNIPLSGGGSLVVNRDNLGDLANVIGMFSPEDINRIMRAIAQDTKAQAMQKEIDDDTNSLGDSADKAVGASDTENSENADLLLALQDKIDEIAEKIKNGDTQQVFQIGGQSFTMEEWEELVAKVDKEIEAIQVWNMEHRLNRKRNFIISFLKV